jgi:hypothetical protein
MKYGVTDSRLPGLGRSFMKGPRFFVRPSQQNCCEKCVYGTGKHSKACERAKEPEPGSDRLQPAKRTTAG